MIARLAWLLLFRVSFKILDRRVIEIRTDGIVLTHPASSSYAAYRLIRQFVWTRSTKRLIFYITYVPRPFKHELTPTVLSITIIPSFRNLVMNKDIVEDPEWSDTDHSTE